MSSQEIGKETLSAWPVSLSSQLNVQLPSTGSLEIFGLDGRIIKRQVCIQLKHAAGLKAFIWYGLPMKKKLTIKNRLTISFFLWACPLAVESDFNRNLRHGQGSGPLGVPYAERRNLPLPNGPPRFSFSCVLRLRHTANAPPGPSRNQNLLC